MVDAALAVLDEAVAKHNPSHVFALFSGGHDSLAATAITAQHPRFTAAVHINTGIGIEETREFVRETCRLQGWPLLEYGPPEHVVSKKAKPLTYEQMVLLWGFPGPPQHKVMYARLKERALDQLVREHKQHRGDHVLLSTGIRHQESTRRMRNYAQHGTWNVHGAMLWANPIFDWTKSDVTAFIEAEGLARNAIVDMLHMSGECLCGAFAKPGEMRELEFWSPKIAAYLHDLERRVEAAGHIRCVWGRRGDDVHRDQLRAFPILPLCQSCEARAE